VIPGGGGSKELALCASDLFHKMMWSWTYCKNISWLSLWQSIYFWLRSVWLRTLQQGKDSVVNKDRQIAEAKKQALMAEAGYTTNS
jgi:3-hydroxyacyl-CoA dehydrogenase